jgi:hypothetical protein
VRSSANESSESLFGMTIFFEVLQRRVSFTVATATRPEIIFVILFAFMFSLHMQEYSFVGRCPINLVTFRF